MNLTAKGSASLSFMSFSSYLILCSFVGLYFKNHNTVAVSGHPNPTHSPSVPGGHRNTQGGRIQKCTGVGTQKHTGGHINAQV